MSLPTSAVCHISSTHPSRQAIHARALYPCQDTPAAKITYAAEVTVPAPLTALMSAIPLDDGKPAADGDGGAKRTTFAFKQEVPIPPYLLALAVGNVEAREIGPRSKVWSEPEMVEAGHQTLGADDMITKDDVRQIFEAMIDAAMGEG